MKWKIQIGDLNATRSCHWECKLCEGPGVGKKGICWFNKGDKEYVLEMRYSRCDKNIDEVCKNLMKVVEIC